MRKLIAAAAACAILSACGGGSGSAPGLPAPQAPASTIKANAMATITVPSKLTTSAMRNPKWISPSTLGIEFNASINGTTVADTFSSLTPASPNCTSGPGGLTCTVPFGVVAGPQNMTVTVYDNATQNNGSPLATVSQPITAVGGITNNYSFTLNGIPAIVYTGAVIPQLTAGTPSSFSAAMVAEDADGNTIPGPFDAPISTSTEDSTGGFTINPGQMSGTGVNLSVNYTGNPSTATTNFWYCSQFYRPFCGSNFHGGFTVMVNVPAGSVYVTNGAGNGQVEAFTSAANGNSPPIRIIPTGTKNLPQTVIVGGGGSPSGVAINSGGTVIYAVPLTATWVNAFPGVSSTSPLTMSTLLRPVTGPLTQMNQPKGIAFDGSNNVWVADSGANALLQYAFSGSSNRAPLRSISGAATTLSAPAGIAFDPGSNSVFAISGANSIVVFSTSATGNVAPAKTITGLTGATGIAIAAGKIYVTNSAANSISIYPTTATGAASPTTVISGAATGLNGPNGIAVDVSGNIYVANTAGNSITVYPSAASGNAAPSRTINGASTQLNAPVGIAVR